MMYISTCMPCHEAAEMSAPCLAAIAQKPRINKTVLRAVKLTAFLLLLGFLHLSARTIAQQRISITMKSAPLEKVFTEIEKQSGYTVFYNVEVLKTAGAITLDMKDATIEDVMHQCLKGLPLEFTVQDKTIFVKKETQRNNSGAVQTMGGPPPETLSGIVHGQAGAPLVGATVYVVKLNRSAVTDKEGKFNLKGVADGVYEIEISYIGYQTYKTKITVSDNEAWLAAELKQSMSNLDETVVKGYYNTTNRLNTGDVTTVKGEDIQKQPVSDPILALEGRVPGLNINQVSGAPGAYSTIQIRGQNSIANGNDPFYIVDGVPFSSISLSSPYTSGGALGYGSFSSNGQGGGISPFNVLNPADIESVTVLKDADATAIYGSRGANGVILITTKRGKVGDTHLDMNVYTGGGQITRMLPMLNTKQYLAMFHEAYANDNMAFPNIKTNPNDNIYDLDGFWDTTRNTNWQKTLIGNVAAFTNAQATISGGNLYTQFVAGGGYSKQGTAFIGNYADEKASAHLNVTHSNNDQRFHMQVGVNFGYNNNNLPGEDFTGAITLPPDAPPLYDKYGNINWQNLNGGATFSNPVASTNINYKAATNNLIGNLNLSYELLPGLQVKSSFGYNRDQMNQTQITPSTVFPAPTSNNPFVRSITYAATTFSSWIVEPQINYQKRLGEGRLEALVGSTFQQRQLNSQTYNEYGFSSDALITNPSAAANVSLDGAANTLYRYDAVYGRLNYNWQEKYLLNLTARRDGSSRFGPDKQFGNFAAVGTGWIFSKERFIERNFPLLSFGKLRASYGTTGNDQIPDYQFLSTYSSISSTYQGYTGLYTTRLTNPYFAWELVKKIEGGIELGFIKDRVLISASLFRNRTGNQLVGLPLPRLTGFGSVQYNLPAEVQNTGVEMTFTTTNIKTSAFSWTSTANLTVPSNKLIAFPNIENLGYGNRYIVGKSLYIQQLYHSTGVNPQTGLYSFATKDPNGPDYPQDLVATKPITQSFYGGVGNQFSYRGFALDIFIQFVKQIGNNYKSSFLPPGLNSYNQPTAVLNRWQTPGELTNTQRFGVNYVAFCPYSTFTQSDGIITNASYGRLKNLALSYQLPTGWKNKLHLQNARIYLQCQNLVTITKYLGVDPETQGLSLPPMRMVTGGLQVSL